MNFSPFKTRRKTREVMVGSIGIGGANPIRVQTMTNTDTLDIKSTVNQIIKCKNAGAELVRLTTQTPKHAEALGKIKDILLKKNIYIPLIADSHFSIDTAMSALKYADKVRINPGNLTNKDDLKEIENDLYPLISFAKKINKPLRIGVNHGSLSKRILNKFGDSPKGMVSSMMEYLRIFKKHKFNEIIVSLKASNPLMMIEANRMLVSAMDKEKMDYPIHLGVTESGNGTEGRTKSIIGIGTLLLDGIGDTIRVSLTEPPEKEIPVCYDILQATGRRISKTEFISCPSCGRTLFDIEKVTNKIKRKLGDFPGIKIAIMGCIVNGLGEMADSDFAYVGLKPGKVNLYQKQELIKSDIPEKNACLELVKIVKKNYSK